MNAVYKEKKKINETNTSDLHLSFDKFNQSSQRLTDLYLQLKKQVELIDIEMEKKNQELNDKVNELNRTTQYTNSILESMHSGVIAADLNGKVTTVNKAAEEILGIKRRKTIGKACEDVIVLTNSSEPLLKKAIKRKRNFMHKKLEVYSFDKHPVWIESCVTLLKDEKGVIIGAVEIFKDLSEIKQLENKLEQADNLASIGEMTASIAHEIRNPLNGIKGFASLLEDGFNKQDPRKKFVNNIIKGVDNLNNMVTDLLVLAKPIKPDIKENNVGEILSEVVSFAREHLRMVGNQINIVTDYNETLLRCDRNLLYQVFFNLLNNSFQAIHGEGTVMVGINPGQSDKKVNGNSDVEVFISDNGIGIDKEIQSKIFEPFYTTKSGGTGLGLSLVQKIIKMHKAHIELDSTPGKGTTFRLLFPGCDRRINDTKYDWRLNYECRPNFSYR